MASPTANNTNNSFKTKVPGSIHQSDRFLEYIQTFCSRLFVSFLFSYLSRYEPKTSTSIDEISITNPSNDPAHSQQLISRMNKLRKAEHLCDVTLKVDQTLFPAHRLVLAAVSDYFAAMFTGEVSFIIYSFLINENEIHLDG